MHFQHQRTISESSLLKYLKKTYINHFILPHSPIWELKGQQCKTRSRFFFLPSLPNNLLNLINIQISFPALTFPSWEWRWECYFSAFSQNRMELTSEQQFEQKAVQVMWRPILREISSCMWREKKSNLTSHIAASQLNYKHLFCRV